MGTPYIPLIYPMHIRGETTLTVNLWKDLQGLYRAYIGLRMLSGVDELGS